MLPLGVDTFRLFLHVLAAAVWVGGQITVAALVPALRGGEDDLARRVALRFAQVAWPAFGLAVVTGIWNLVEADLTNRSTAYQVTLFVKLVVVAASGIGAWLHSQARGRLGLALWGAVSGAAALGALFVGVWLRS